MKSAKKAVKKAAAARRKAAVKKTARVGRKAAAARADGGASVPHPAFREEYAIKMRNLGPIKEANLTLRPLTVLAGPNNTGKTFCSKSLYSVFRALNADHLMVEFNDRAGPPRECLQWLRGERYAASSPLVDELAEAVNRMELVAKKCPAEGLTVRPEHKYPALAEAGEKVDSVFDQLEPDLRHWSERKIEHGSGGLRELGRMTAGDIASAGFQSQVVRNFLNNFQIFRAEELKGKEGDSSIDINGKRILSLEEGWDGKGWDGIKAGTFPILQLRGRANVLFLESPALWRLKGVLESALLDSRNERTRSDVPEHFRDLLAALPKEYSGKMPFPEVYRRLTEEVIGGKIVRSDSGLLRFAESGGGNYPLSRTATGVVNLGILAMLIERKLVDKGTFLFIDEPESNLHPRWQEIMAETLARLAAAGAHIVVATHSDWMLSAIANIVRRGELGEDNGEEAALTKEQVGVWLFDRGKKDGGATTRELAFDSVTGYIPKNLRDFSNALHNETADLLDAMDERERSNAVKEGAE